jgi:hypothetical protein
MSGLATAAGRLERMWVLAGCHCWEPLFVAARGLSSVRKTPIVTYESNVADGRLKEDEYQVKIAQLLTNLHGKIEDYVPLQSPSLQASKTKCVDFFSLCSFHC